MNNPYPIISVAPMMNYTDRHARFFLRLIAPDIRLYTEMITTYALLKGDVAYLLSFNPQEKYVALQLGGSHPHDLAQCAKLGEEFGYDEINLNVGCPSSRVCSNRFGASLMLEPALVATCVAAMKARVKIPVTVKCRIGVDACDAYHDLASFIETVKASGCQQFIIHARKAWLKGLSPKENREIPKLQYERVRQIKRDFPDLSIIINGGIKTLDDMHQQLPGVDGLMIGRAAYANPYFLKAIQAEYFGERNFFSRAEIIERFLPYVNEQLRNKIKLKAMTRHMLGLFQGERGASAWRRYLSEHAHESHAGTEVIKHALSLVTG